MSWSRIGQKVEQPPVVFKALADPNRLRLLSLIKASESGERCFCDLTEPLGLGNRRCRTT